MIWSAPSSWLTHRIELGLSDTKSTNAGWRSKLPPKSMRLPILCLSSSFARSVRVKGAEDLTDNLNQTNYSQYDNQNHPKENHRLHSKKQHGLAKQIPSY